MADTGWVLASVGTNEAVSGGINWTGPNNITTADDNTYATSNLGKGDQVSAYLNAVFPSLVPTGTEIKGVEARIRRVKGSASAAVMKDHTLQLRVGGSRVGSNLADTVTEWDDTPIANVDYGGPTNLWGTSLTPEQVNAAGFGISFRASTSNGNSPYVFTVWIKVHYAVPSGSSGSFFTMFSVKDRIREILKPKPRFWLPEPILT